MDNEQFIEGVRVGFYWFDVQRLQSWTSSYYRYRELVVNRGG